MDISQKILSDITVFNKYAKYIPELGRRENWAELCERNMDMHLKRYPDLTWEIKSIYKNFVLTKKVLPSMRSMQFGGRPIELANNRMFNCAYIAVDNPATFWESMFLLLGGSGVGFSVQTHHVDQLPIVVGHINKTRRYLIGDSIEGWADAIRVLIRAYFEGRSDPEFDYRDIRPKGAKLITSGGKAPGPAPLRICIEQIRKVLNGAIGRRLSPLECHDIMCHIADSVLSGGIRRAALISLFSPHDMDMLSCKVGMWWELNPQRGRANNSVVLERGKVDEEMFLSIWQRVKASGCGEPGFSWTNDKDMGANPCHEISLKSMQFCNLTEVNVSDVDSQEELNARCEAAAFIGTLQAGYTNFHYLRPQWIENTEKDALIGVGMTGIGSGKVLKFNLEEAAEVVKAENERVAQAIGINKAARCTTIKPSGTSSLTVGSSSGIHAWYNDYYIRRMRVGKNEALYGYMKEKFPELIEDCQFKPHLEAVMMFPQKAPEGAILRTEPAINLLRRVRKFNQEWIHKGYREGANHHNVSCFSGDTKFLTKDQGYVRFDSFNDGDTVDVLTHDGSYTPALVKNFGKQEIVEITLSRGGNKGTKDFIIKTTKDHFWFVANNYKRYRGGVLNYNLMKTKNLMSVSKPQLPRIFPTNNPTFNINLQALCHGIVFGDGTRSKIAQKNGFGGAISLCHDSRHLKKYFEQAGFTSIVEKDELNQTYIGRLPWEWKELPLTKDPEYLFSFIAGWFAADGFVHKDKREVSILNYKKENIQWIIDNCQICGLATSCEYSSIIQKKGYKPGAEYFYLNFIKSTIPDNFFVHDKKAERWITSKPSTQSEKFYTVKDIKYTGIYEDVWCVVEPRNSAFVIFGNILTHNCTISVREDEWDMVGEWMWNNKKYYTGISVLPYDGGTYPQAPFEDCHKEIYDYFLKFLKDINLDEVVEHDDNTNLMDQSACAGGACELVI